MKKSILAFFVVLLAGRGGLASPATAPASSSPEAPAGALYDGFVVQPLKFEVQHPYDLPEEARYSYDKATDTHDLWVHESDKPHLPPPNKTEARTELRLQDDNYKPGSGLHMMDCELFIVPGTFACISQVFGTGPMSIIVVDANGRIYDLRTNVTIADHMNGKWFHWTIVHDPNAVGLGAIKIYVDGKLADGQVGGKKEASYYFKIGVYSRKGSNRNEVKVRNLRYLIKPPAEK